MKYKNKKVGLQVDTGLNRLGVQIKELIKKDLRKMNLFILTLSILSLLYVSIWLVYSDRVYKKKKEEFEDRLKKFENKDTEN